MNKTDSPIHSFLMRSVSFKTTDVAVLFALIAAQEVASEGDYPISPHAERRLWSLQDLPEDELKASVERLIEAGEVVRVVDEARQLKGLKVVRFEQLQDFMTVFGQRRYSRLAARKHRNKLKEEAAI